LYHFLARYGSDPEHHKPRNDVVEDPRHKRAERHCDGMIGKHPVMQRQERCEGKIIAKVAERIGQYVAAPLEVELANLEASKDQKAIKQKGQLHGCC